MGGVETPSAALTNGDRTTLPAVTPAGVGEPYAVDSTCMARAAAGLLLASMAGDDVPETLARAFTLAIQLATANGMGEPDVELEDATPGVLGGTGDANASERSNRMLPSGRGTARGAFDKDELCVSGVPLGA